MLTRFSSVMLCASAYSKNDPVWAQLSSMVPLCALGVAARPVTCAEGEPRTAECALRAPWGRELTRDLLGSNPKTKWLT